MDVVQDRTSELGKPLGAVSLTPRCRPAFGRASYFLILPLLFLIPVRSSYPATTTQPAAAHASHDGNQNILRLAGKTHAVASRAIIAPLLAGQKVGTLTVTWLAPNGAHVKRGELLVTFDQTSQIQDYMDAQAKASNENDKVLEAQAKEIADRAKDKTDIVKAEDSLRKAKLEMRKVSILSRIDAEKTRETLDEAKATLAQLQQTYALKRKAAEASIRILELQQALTKQEMLHAKANASLLQIRSPIDGIVVYKSIWKNGTMGDVQEGDQVRSGVPFMHVVDPEAMEVQVKVNQEDLLALHSDESARVYLDAYPNLVFPAHLESIDPVGVPGGFSPRLRTFAATFLIEGSDARLMPDLSAAVEVHTHASAATVGRHP